MIIANYGTIAAANIILESDAAFIISIWYGVIINTVTVRKIDADAANSPVASVVFVKGIIVDVVIMAFYINS